MDAPLMLLALNGTRISCGRFCGDTPAIVSALTSSVAMKVSSNAEDAAQSLRSLGATARALTRIGDTRLAARMLLPLTPVSQTQILIELSRSSWIRSLFSFARIQAESRPPACVAIGNSITALLTVPAGRELAAVAVKVTEKGPATFGGRVSWNCVAAVSWASSRREVPAGTTLIPATLVVKAMSKVLVAP